MSSQRNPCLNSFYGDMLRTFIQPTTPIRSDVSSPESSDRHQEKRKLNYDTFFIGDFVELDDEQAKGKAVSQLEKK